MDLKSERERKGRKRVNFHQCENIVNFHQCENIVNFHQCENIVNFHQCENIDYYMLSIF